VSGATIALLLIGMGSPIRLGHTWSLTPGSRGGSLVSPSTQRFYGGHSVAQTNRHKKDIFEIGKVATYKRELDAALGTRGMLQFILEQPLTKELLMIQNPMATQDQLDDTFQTIMQERHDKLYLACHRRASDICRCSVARPPSVPGP
jgi:hypothetical protein